MPSAFDAFVASLTSSDRHFAQDFDTAAAASLTGDEREEAIERLVRILDQGGDPRAPRCLAAMNAHEASTELFIAASTGQPTTRMEAALAHRKVAGPGPLVRDTAVDLLTNGTQNAQVLAVRTLTDIGDTATLRDTALNHPSPGIRGEAFAGWLPKPMVHQGPSHALSQRLIAGPLALARACGPELDAYDPAADVAANTSAPPFPELRQKLIDGTLAASDLTRCGDSERALLLAWAAWDLGEKLDTAPRVAMAVALPGAREALEELRPQATGSFLAAIDQALAGG
ncbi:MAG: hypothetical protein EP330_10445 [Deltaproteobacteria bacterium]|nr:MAG: hypothetical protein EP330_10445 [Deltaproteobacteria bacterium]